MASRPWRDYHESIHDWLRSQATKKHRQWVHANDSCDLDSWGRCDAAMDRSDSTLEVCCHLGIATEHAIYACSFAKALCRLCYRASYKIRKACERIFPSSACSAKQTCARVRSYPTQYYLFGVHAQVSLIYKTKITFWWQNKFRIEFWSQCHIFRGYRSHILCGCRIHQ